MIRIKVVQRDGSEITIEPEPGPSLMEALCDAGFDELLALCGGNCTCSTCHIHIDDASLSKLAPMSNDENDLLDSSSHRNEHSRLSCQIPVSPDLDGSVVTIARDD